MAFACCSWERCLSPHTPHLLLRLAGPLLFHWQRFRLLSLAAISSSTDDRFVFFCDASPPPLCCRSIAQQLATPSTSQSVAERTREPANINEQHSSRTDNFLLLLPPPLLLLQPFRLATARNRRQATSRPCKRATERCCRSLRHGR